MVEQEKEGMGKRENVMLCKGRTRRPCRQEYSDNGRTVLRGKHMAFGP